jgi:GR25 family glycosyltransferase involved in LPS biosynthesis
LKFEKIYVVNLPERSDRRDSIILSAALSNIDIEIVDAVRGENVLEKAIPHPEVGRFMKAEIGCWRSHINIMQECVSPLPPFKAYSAGWNHQLMSTKCDPKEFEFGVYYRR